MPVEVNYPALGRWLARVAAQPGYERTYPPHWREHLTVAGDGAVLGKIEPRRADLIRFGAARMPRDF